MGAAKGSSPITKIYKGKKLIWKSVKYLEGTIVDEYQVGNLVLYDNIQNKKIVVDINKPSQKFYVSDYTPIAVIVIPQSHNVYKTGEAGAISILSMSCDTPSTGSNTNKMMYWGPSVDIGELPNLKYIAGLGTCNQEIQNKVVNTTVYGYIPSDKLNTFLGKDSPQDPITKYYTNPSATNSWISSPYNADDSRNLLYSQNTNNEGETIPNIELNACSDFDGRRNTNKLIEYRGVKDYSSWLPTSNVQDDCPAASCCDMFHTPGTNQGDWYLPSAAELGYVIPRWAVIRSTIQTAVDLWGDSFAVPLIESGNYWTSTEYQFDNARNISVGSGGVYGNPKNTDGYVRAFMRISEYNTNGYEYVNMGEAGIWTKYNLNAHNPYEVGTRVPWAELEQTASGKTWETYKWGDGTDEFHLTKYITHPEYGTPDNKEILEPEDDAIHLTMGGDWRLPSQSDYEKLLELCDLTWEENYENSGVNGILFTLKSNSDKQLFFPALSYDSAAYWSSTRHPTLDSYARRLTISPELLNHLQNNWRIYSNLMRGFIPKN